MLRGYVQIDAEASNGRTAIAGSKALALYYPNSSGKVAFGPLDPCRGGGKRSVGDA